MSEGSRAAFYKTTAWQQTAKAYAKSKQNLCEVCLSHGLYRPGIFVHHKIHLNDQNLTDPAISLSWDNLQLLCCECHAKAHSKNLKRYQLDEMGRVIITDYPPMS